MTAAVDTISIITWWLEVGVLAFAGGTAVGLGVSWLFCSQDPTAQVDPSAPGAWPPILGALRAASKNETALSNAEHVRRYRSQPDNGVIVPLEPWPEGFPDE